MKSIKLKYCVFLLLCMTLITCKNKTKTPVEEKDLLELINYPAWMDTIDCSRFDQDYKPYPCLELNKKNMQEIDSLYGEPLYISTDTLYYGWEKGNRPYSYDDQDFFITKMLSKIPVAKVIYTNRSDMGYILYLYFIEHNNQNVAFYGFRISPYRMLD